MQTLREAIEKAREKGVALGHFNVSDSNQFNAIIAAAVAANMPVVVGASEGERKFFGVRALAAVVASARASGVQVYLNADHTYSVELVKEAIDAGFDSVIFDGSHLPLEENIAQTREAVAYARGCGREVLVEGEIGRIGTSSKLLDKAPDDIDKELTSPDEAARFVRESGVDLLAPAVGTMHGRLKSGEMPRIDTKREAFPAALPWALDLANGLRCTFLTGATSGVAGMRVNYGCDDGKTWIIGDVDRSLPKWRVFVLSADRVVAEQEDVTVAWY